MLKIKKIKQCPVCQSPEWKYDISFMGESYCGDCYTSAQKAGLLQNMENAFDALANLGIKLESDRVKHNAFVASHFLVGVVK